MVNPDAGIQFNDIKEELEMLLKQDSEYSWCQDVNKIVGKKGFGHNNP